MGVIVHGRYRLKWSKNRQNWEICCFSPSTDFGLMAHLFSIRVTTRAITFHCIGFVCMLTSIVYILGFSFL